MPRQRKTKTLLPEPEPLRRRDARPAPGADEEPATLPDARHPLETLQGAVGNQAVLRLLARSRPPAALRSVQRKGPATQTALTEAQARTELQTHWGVGRVDAGTIADQEQHMRTNSMQYFGSPTPPANLGALLAAASWSTWKPAGTSSMWGDLVRAFQDLAKAFGGIPPVREVLFFKTDYVYDAAAPGGPALKASNQELASFGGGQYAIFEAATYQGTLMPLAQGKSVAGSPPPVGSRPVPFTLVHELGHGLVEAIQSQVDPDMLRKYQQEVGWFQGRLFDAGVQSVRTAIQNNTAPPSQYEITAANWSDAGWQEQPVSKYSLDGPWEDFPEAVAAYVRDPAMLLARSPRRHAFVARIAAALQQGAGSPLRARTP